MGRAALLLGASILTSVPAHAENAQSLYDQGLKDMLAERFSEGCPLLERSVELDPLPGAIFTLAACYGRWGKTLTASQRYDSFLRKVAELPEAERAKQDDRVKTAKEKLAELAPLIPKLTLRFTATPGPGVTAELDGRRLPPGDIGVPIPLDPGEHRVVVKDPREGQALGVTSQEAVVRLQPGDQRTLELEIAAGQPTGDGSQQAGAAEGEEPDEPTPVDGDTIRTIGFVVGGVGVAGIVVGAITGGMVMGKKGTVSDNCEGDVCTQEGLDAVDSAKPLALVSNVGFGVGLAALAAGVLMVLLAPSDAEAAPETETEPAPEVGVWLSAPSAAEQGTGAVLGVQGAW